MAENNINKILNAIENNKTSLGDNPAFPPDDENKLLAVLVKHYYDLLPEDTLDEDALSKALTECMKEEQRCKPMLEELAGKFITQTFNITDNANIEFDLKLVDNVDSSDVRMFPEKVDDFTFEDIDDMNTLAGEIYKRRMLNALIAGAAHDLGLDAESWIPEIKKINSHLPELYKKIIDSNDKFLYQKDLHGSTDDNVSDGGKVSVYLGGEDAPVKINAEAIIFPVLVMEATKGILELAISHGLPSDRKKALYIMSKADFKFAEVWDERLGIALWRRICEVAESTGHDCLMAIGINYIFMEIATMPVDEFNIFVSNVLAKTNKGVAMFKDLCDKIEYNREHDEFDVFINGMETDSETPVSYYDADNADELLLGDSVIYC